MVHSRSKRLLFAWLAAIVAAPGCKPEAHGTEVVDAAAESSTRAVAPSATTPTPTPTPTPSEAPTSSAATPVIAKDYDGPLGLKWGQAPAEVKKALASKLAFVNEGPGDDGKTFTQHYKGAFAGMTPEAIEVDFFEKKLIAVVAQLQAKDVRPASRRWLDLVDKTAESHGKPGKLSPVPNVPKLSAALSAYPETPNAEKIRALGSLFDDMNEQAGNSLDRKIERGDWTPLASWKFANDAGIVASVTVGAPDAHGHRELVPFWMAMGGDFKAWSEAVKSKPDL